MMSDTKNNGSGPDAVSMIKEEEELLENRPSFCFLVKTWTIYYITLTFALLAIFRYLAPSTIIKHKSNSRTVYFASVHSYYQFD